MPRSCWKQNVCPDLHSARTRAGRHTPHGRSALAASYPSPPQGGKEPAEIVVKTPPWELAK